MGTRSSIGANVPSTPTAGGREAGRAAASRKSELNSRKEDSLT